MESDSLPTDIILTHPHRQLGQIKLDWMPQPGNSVDVEGKIYTVLERHHHYKYRVSGYYLQKMCIYVQCAPQTMEKSFLQGRWVLGDISCRFNAQSEILRCAVNPQGPCQDCRFYDSGNSS